MPNVLLITPFKAAVDVAEVVEEEAAEDEAVIPESLEEDEPAEPPPEPESTSPIDVEAEMLDEQVGDEEEEELPEIVQEDTVVEDEIEMMNEPEPAPEVENEGEGEAEVAVVSDAEQSTKTEGPYIILTARLVSDGDALNHTGKRKASEALSETPRDRKRPRETREDSEPVDEDEQGGLMPHAATATMTLTHYQGPSTSKGRRKAHAGDKKFQNVIGMLHSTISQHRYGNIFHNPIKKTEAADYHDIVKRPMDLKTIKARVKDGLISNSLEFQRDICLMFANAMMYNRPGSEIHNMAEEVSCIPHTRT